MASGCAYSDNSEDYKDWCTVNGPQFVNHYGDNSFDLEGDQFSIGDMWDEGDPYVVEVPYVEHHKVRFLSEEDNGHGDSNACTNVFKGQFYTDESFTDKFRVCGRHEENDMYKDSTECRNVFKERWQTGESFDEFRQELRDKDVSSVSTSPRDRMSCSIADKVERLDHVTLNVAVTGNTGAGKSTFVNAIRGLSNDDDGAAETGVTETTRQPQPFQHPTMPNVIIWDLPGIGTPNFKARTYLTDVNFERYDFFIILTSERFKENDINLAKAIKKKKRLFYFVRSKIDNDINAEHRRKAFNREGLLTNIREDCKNNLKCVGSPQVFLISSFRLQEYDFTRLIDTLTRDLPNKKKQALIQSLPVYSVDTLTRKKKHFQKMISLQAFGSCVGAMLPIPGLTLGVDYGIVTSFFNKVFRSFGLDDSSLQRLASRVGMDHTSLKNTLQSRFKDGITDEVLMSFLNTPSVASVMTLKTVLSAFVVVGSLPAGIISAIIMRRILNEGLEEMAEDAEILLAEARLDKL